MEKFKKFSQALQNLKPDTEYSYSGDVPTSEELFNNVDWITGVEVIPDCPHEEHEQ